MSLKTPYAPVRMSPTDFVRLSNFIYTKYGIKMPPVKKTMLEGRLQKRLRALNLKSFKAYGEYVLSLEGHEQELIEIANAVTTNKTDFFREADHFDFFSDVALPELVGNNRGKILNAWSAGCASGEEAYTMAITFEEFGKTFNSFGYSILATDVCTEVLEKGRLAIYTEDRVETIPLEVKKKYFMRSKDVDNRTVRIVPSLRKKVSFCELNFMDTQYPIDCLMDIIMCRNVLIYFDRQTQENVIAKLTSRLQKGGYLFLGHSENITDMNVSLLKIKPTVFKKL